MTKKAVAALSLIFLLIGIIAGFLISPAKNGMKFENESENNYYTNKKD